MHWFAPNFVKDFFPDSVQIKIWCQISVWTKSGQIFLSFVQTWSRLESGFDLVQTKSRYESGQEKIQTLDKIWTSTDDGHLCSWLANSKKQIFLRCVGLDCGVSLTVIMSNDREMEKLPGSSIFAFFNINF